MQEGLIYLVTNKVNGKKYVGQTIQTLRRRWPKHQSSARSGSDKAIHAAIRKYGIEQFSTEVIAESLVLFLDTLEEFYIRLYCSHTSHFGYNMTWGGLGCRGYKMSPESIEKTRQANLGRIPTLTARENMSKSGKGKAKSEKHCMAISAGQTGMIHPPERRMNNSLGQIGRKDSDEVRLKKSTAQIKRQARLKQLKELCLKIK